MPGCDDAGLRRFPTAGHTVPKVGSNIGQTEIRNHLSAWMMHLMQWLKFFLGDRFSGMPSQSTVRACRRLFESSMSVGEKARKLQRDTIHLAKNINNLENICDLRLS
jgi:hypothetical protein